MYQSDEIFVESPHVNSSKKPACIRPTLALCSHRHVDPHLKASICTRSSLHWAFTNLTLSNTFLKLGPRTRRACQRPRFFFTKVIKRFHQPSSPPFSKVPFLAQVLEEQAPALPEKLRATLEARSAGIQAWLASAVMPTLLQAMLHVARSRAEDPAGAMVRARCAFSSSSLLCGLRFFVSCHVLR
jgi:hypothetical protein